MNDTTPEVARRYREMLMERSGAERLKMGCSMFSTARAFVVASVLEKEAAASPVTLRCALFMRFYGADFGADERQRIVARLEKLTEMVALPTGTSSRQMTLLKPADVAAVTEFADKVRSALGSDVLDLRLFGSKATGQDAPDSDIDILVVVAEARTDVEDRILAIAFDVNLAHDVFISPSVVGQATLDDPVWQITPFLKAALAGVRV